MKEKLNIKTIRAVFPVIALAFLFLLSPCKVRNFIETELDIPQTNTINKSQSTISSYNCADFEIDLNTLTKEKASQYSTAFAVGYSYLSFSHSDFFNNYIKPHEARNHSASTIPFYILYQNFKTFL